jgi:hypothetical protein
MPVKKTGKGTKKSGTAQKPAGPRKKPATRLVTVVILSLMFAFIFFELFYIILKQKKANLKPALVNSFAINYKRLGGMSVSGSRVYILDNLDNLIIAYEKGTGRPADSIKLGAAPEWAVEADDGSLLIIFENDSSVYRMAGKALEKVITEGIKDPLNIVLDGTGSLIVSDIGAGKILKFGRDFKPVFEVSQKGKYGNFRRLGKVAVDKDGNIYAMDMDAKTGTKFTKDGKFVMNWPVFVKKGLYGFENIVVSKNGVIYINDWDDAAIRTYSSSGKVIGSFNEDAGNRYKIGAPGAFAGDPDGRLYVCSNMVAVFEPLSY